MPTIRTWSSDGAAHGFGSFRWDLALCGEPIDHRGHEAVRLAHGQSGRVASARYDLEGSCRVLVDGAKCSSRELKRLLGSARQVMLESTTLGLVETLLLTRAAFEAQVPSIDYLYVEPASYRRETAVEAPWTRDFSLSRSTRFEAVNGFMTLLTDVPARSARVVAFLGYEGARLSQACDQLSELSRWQGYAVFGVPGYAPGWEMNAIANNIETLTESRFDSVRYCGASSVSGALALLEAIRAEGRDDDVQLVIAPLGTKPHGIATALFLVEHARFQRAALIYDHPARSQHRSEAVRRWHLYRATFGVGA